MSLYTNITVGEPGEIFATVQVRNRADLASMLHAPLPELQRAARDATYCRLRFPALSTGLVRYAWNSLPD